MKRAFVILFSLLLIATQTFAVARPVSSGPMDARHCCCEGCVQCACCLTGGETDSTPQESAATVAPVINQFVFILSTQVLLGISPTSAESFRAASNASLAAVQPPIFQRNCVFLI